MNMYYRNNAERLHKIVDGIVLQFGGIAGKDMDDFYSLANEVFVDVMNRYDSTQSFDGFLYSCLNNKVKSEITRRNRYKRMAERMSISMDTLLGDDAHSTLADILVSEVDIEKEVIEQNGDWEAEGVVRYLGSLSKIQREIIEMKMQGAEVQYIKKKLGLTNKQYASYMSQAIKYEHIRFLNI